jgi:hypothetical protein
MLILLELLGKQNDLDQSGNKNNQIALVRTLSIAGCVMLLRYE